MWDGPGLDAFLKAFHLPELPLLSGPPLPFSCFLTSAWGELPVAGTGNTSSSLAGSSPATPVEGPAEPHSERVTRKAMAPHSLPPAQPHSH